MRADGAAGARAGGGSGARASATGGARSPRPPSVGAGRRPPPGPVRLAPDLPPVNLAIRVRKPLDDHLADMIHALRGRGSAPARSS